MRLGGLLKADPFNDLQVGPIGYEDTLVIPLNDNHQISGTVGERLLIRVGNVRSCSQCRHY